MVQAVKAAEHIFALALGNAGPVVGDGDACVRAVPMQGNLYDAAARSVAQRVFQNVGERLKQQVAVAADGDAAVCRRLRRRGGDALLFFLGERLVEFRDIRDQRAQIHFAAGRGLPRLNARDSQQRVKSGQQRIGFLDRALQRARRFRVWRLARARFLQPLAKARQRCAQVVGDTVGDAADVLHQPLNTVEHLV